MKIKLLLISLYLFMLPIEIYADDLVNNNRPFSCLELGVRTTYPPEITTVGQAIMYILASTDYKVAIGFPASSSSASIAARPIPPEAEQNEIMPIYKVLLLLIGKNSRLVVDTQHKLLTFETIPK